MTFDLSLTTTDPRPAKLDADRSDAVREAVARGLDIVAGEARANIIALRDPGRPLPSLLANSIATGIAEDGMSGTVSAGGAIAPYAPFVEFGTTRAPAQPFLGPALATHAERIRRDIVTALGQALGRAS